MSHYYWTLNNQTVGRADPEYLRLIIDEGKRRGFPQDYLDEIAFWGDPLWGSIPARAS